MPKKPSSILILKNVPADNGIFLRSGQVYHRYLQQLYLVMSHDDNGFACVRVLCGCAVGAWNAFLQLLLVKNIQLDQACAIGH